MFFFKQKTAYEMRISDWSSDVCSSDLRFRLGGRRTCGCGDVPPNLFRERHAAGAIRRCRSAAFLYVGIPDGAPPPTSFIVTSLDGATNGRSEEHTSELQSLMRISYAVFCLKKKNIKSRPRK